jgi:hypothetical protein
MLSVGRCRQAQPGTGLNRAANSGRFYKTSLQKAGARKREKQQQQQKMRRAPVARKKNTGRLQRRVSAGESSMSGAKRSMVFLWLLGEPHGDAPKRNLD